MSVSLLAVALTATFGAAAGYAVSGWRELQRAAIRLNFTNPDTAGYPEIPLARALIAGAFLGAAAGAGGSALYNGATATQEKAVCAMTLDESGTPVPPAAGQTCRPQ